MKTAAALLLFAALAFSPAPALASAPLTEENSPTANAHARLVAIWNRNLRAFGNTLAAREHALSEIRQNTSVVLARLTKAGDGLFVRFKDGSVSAIALGVPGKE